MPLCNLTTSKTFPPTTIIFRLAREAHATSFTPEKTKHLPTPSAFNLLMDRIHLASFWGMWWERKLAKPIGAKVSLLFKGEKRRRGGRRGKNHKL